MLAHWMDCNWYHLIEQNHNELFTYTFTCTSSQYGYLETGLWLHRLHFYFMWFPSILKCPWKHPSKSQFYSISQSLPGLYRELIYACEMHATWKGGTVRDWRDGLFGKLLLVPSTTTPPPTPPHSHTHTYTAAVRQTVSLRWNGSRENKLSPYRSQTNNSRWKS